MFFISRRSCKEIINQSIQSVIKVFFFLRSLSLLLNKNLCKILICNFFSYNLVQTTLKHKRENKDFFTQNSLLKFLLDAVTALDYCHSHCHVHCNLTSESLFTLKNDTMAKLCGFHLCFELVDGQGEMDSKLVMPKIKPYALEA